MKIENRQTAKKNWCYLKATSKVRLAWLHPYIFLHFHKKTSPCFNILLESQYGAEEGHQIYLKGVFVFLNHPVMQFYLNGKRTGYKRRLECINIEEVRWYHQDIFGSSLGKVDGL